MSNCSANVYRPHSMRSSPCNRNATMVHEGKGYCAMHFPPSMEARDKQRQAKYDAEWAAKQKQWREARLGERALDYMRSEYPEMVQEWEQEMK